MSVPASPRVCVVIVTYNSGKTLAKCLSALEAQSFTDFNLIVVDNASDQRPSDLLQSYGRPYTYLEMAENLGFAQAMNEALQVTSASLFVALNPDAFPKRDWLSELVEAADKAKNVAAFGSVQLRAEAQGDIDGYGDHFLISGQAWRGISIPEESARALHYCFGVCAAAALYRTELLKRIGGFDRRFFCFYEDVDVSFRLRLIGHECAVVSSAIVEHIGGASFAGKSELSDYLISRNLWWVVLKDMPIALLPISVMGFVAVRLLSSLVNPRRSRLKGLWDGIRATGDALKARRDIQRQKTTSTAEIMRIISFWPPAFLARKTVVLKSEPF